MQTENSLDVASWRALASAHFERVKPPIEAHRARRARGQKHPVWDFLWEYYSFKPSLLERWSPGVGVALEIEAERLPDERLPDELLARPEPKTEWSRSGEFWALDAARFPFRRLEALREILALLQSTHERPARHDCFGLHEWAMVYRAEGVRHDVPLRLGDAAIAKVVESNTVRCSHYDAFRFFTPLARPLNVLQPDFNNRPHFEQPGCIHANMDLYKWAAKFAPWVPSSVIADAFELALEARELDMRAAPYNLRAFGFEPIPLETSEGRRDYAQKQRELAQKAAPIRARLIEAYAAILAWLKA